MESNKAMKLFFILSFVMGELMLTSCYKRPSPENNPMTAEVKEGQVLYMKYCQKCHPDGEAGLGPSAYYPPGFMKRMQVRHGFGAMPKFDKSVISKNQLDKIILYLKFLNETE